MRVLQLRIDGLRNLNDVVIEPGPGLNIFCGDNGAGKTSILEALHCLSRGRSFRGGGRHDYLARTTRQTRIVADLEDGPGKKRIGFERSSGGWRGRLNGVDIRQLGELAENFAFAVFHPELHQLIEGPPDERRRFLDYGVFHVEQAFYGHWRNYRRCLSQRNAALRSKCELRSLAAWNEGLVSSGTAVTESRKTYVKALNDAFQTLLKAVTLEIDHLKLELAPGWPEEESFSDVLSRQSQSDFDAGFTRLGPHRADLRLRDNQGKISGRLSRGQQKMVALALLLAQVDIIGQNRGEPPVIGFDDLPSELDRGHQEKISGLLLETGAQIWITGTEKPELPHYPADTRMFHVEQGKVSEVV